MTKIAGLIKFLGIMILAFFMESSILFALAVQSKSETLKNADDVAKKVVATREEKVKMLATIAFPAPDTLYDDDPNLEQEKEYYEQLKDYGEEIRRIQAKDAYELDQDADKFLRVLGITQTIKIKSPVFFGDDFDKRDNPEEKIVSNHESSWMPNRQTLTITPILNLRVPKEVKTRDGDTIYPWDILIQFEIREAIINRLLMGEVSEEEQDSEHWANMQNLTLAAITRYEPALFEDFVKYINSPEAQNHDPKYKEAIEAFKTAVNFFYRNRRFLQSQKFVFFYNNDKTAKGFLKSLEQVSGFNKEVFTTQVLESLQLAYST
jgi:hypothetical protein